MDTTELKLEIHKILDRIEDEQFLRTFYDFLKREYSSEEQLLKSLTDLQKLGLHSPHINPDDTHTRA